MDCLAAGRDYIGEEQPGNSPSIVEPSQILERSGRLQIFPASAGESTDGIK
jgi:hypothetical protein